MIRWNLLLTLSAMCAALLLSGCFMPMVSSMKPFYPPGDKGFTVDGLMNKWVSENGETLTIKHDDYAGEIGDFIFTFTMPMLPEPMPEGYPQGPPPVARDDDPKQVFNAHVFEVDGQTYCDISIPAPQPEPMPDVKPTPQAVMPGEGQPGGHVLCRMELGLGTIGLQVMDVTWFLDYLDYTGKHAGEIKTMSATYSEHDTTPSPLIYDTPENIWAFIKRHENDGLWGMSVTFSKPPSP